MKTTFFWTDFLENAPPRTIRFAVSPEENKLEKPKIRIGRMPSRETLSWRLKQGRGHSTIIKKSPALVKRGTEIRSYRYTRGRRPRHLTLAHARGIKGPLFINMDMRDKFIARRAYLA